MKTSSTKPETNEISTTFADWTRNPRFRCIKTSIYQRETAYIEVLKNKKKTFETFVKKRVYWTSGIFLIIDYSIIYFDTKK